jgi:hypothetical protein
MMLKKHGKIWMAAASMTSMIVMAFILSADEGMWPISEIQKLNLKAKGLEISPEEIYNPDGSSLIDGIVQVGGCSGSFVSPEGLILTNHHCAYGAVQAASSAEKDYVKEGFLARVRGEEIEAKGMTARITESYRDVSEQVLAAIKPEMDLAERTKAIEKRIKEIVAEVEKNNLGKRAEVAEMFIGKTYVLFVYTYLRDIRLVYVPPRSIGEFGGEEDNWMWPRHTGDFSFMRAYVGPDGSPADFSAKNVPYRPKRVIKIAPEGVRESDFVFILGYPGRTYRHQTSHYLAYEEEIRMPYVADWYAWQIDVMQKMGENDREVVIKHLSRIKGLSNTMKNYRGKLKGLKRLGLVERKRAEERRLQDYIESNDQLKKEYGHILGEIGNVYAQLQDRAAYELLMSDLNRSVNMLNFGYTLYEAALERQKADLERESAYMDRNYPLTVRRLKIAMQNYYEPTDKIIFKELLMRASMLPPSQRIKALDAVLGENFDEKSIDRFIEKAYAEKKITDEKALEDALDKSPEALKSFQSPFIRLAEALYPEYKELDETQKARRGALDQLYAELIDVKREFMAQDFVPDANRTLRLTFGTIRGYSPADAVHYQPITTLDGVIEKSTGEEPFDTPQKIFELFEAKDYGRFIHPDLDSVPVCILYDMDTTGGNSGSPVLNARGELVGINFDRAFEATINDYAWSEDYSRSIAVDIRYVLWVTQKYGEVDYLLKEIGVL